MSTEDVDIRVELNAWELNEEGKRADKYTLIIQNGEYEYGDKYYSEIYIPEIIYPDDIPADIASALKGYGIDRIRDDPVDEPEQPDPKQVESKIDVGADGEVYRYSICFETTTEVKRNDERIEEEDVPNYIQDAISEYIPERVE